jgi:hypothetical protein
MRSSSNFLNMDAFFIIFYFIPQFSRLCHRWVLFYFLGYYLSRCGLLVSRLAILYRDGYPVQENSEFPVTLADMQGSADVPVGCVQKLHDFPFVWLCLSSLSAFYASHFQILLILLIPLFLLLFLC